MITADAAKAVDLNDRGVLAAGFKANVNIFDLEQTQISAPSIYSDLPGGSTRLMQLASGFRATIVSGVVTRENDIATGALPGRLLRHKTKVRTTEKAGVLV